MNFLIFKIRYHVHLYLSKLFEPKRHEYIMFFLGRYPDNFKYGFKAILDANSMFRYSIGSSCIVLRFDTKKNISEVLETLNKIYYGHMDSFFIFNANDIHAKVLDNIHYKHLYDPETEVTNTQQSLDKIHDFIDVLKQMRYSLMNLLKQNQEMEETLISEIPSENITMEDIDPILEKIKESGIESLSEQEKLILKKYTKND